jgi:hypothetical protein
MCSSPLFDIRQDLYTHLPQGLFIHLVFCSLLRAPMDLSYHFPFLWVSAKQEDIVSISKGRERRVEKTEQKES